MIERPKAQFLNRQTQPHMATLSAGDEYLFTKPPAHGG